MKPLFSVVIPCYNEEANLSRLFIRIKELLSSYPKGEVVLVNNGSSDNSLSLMNTFKLENQGLHINICNVKENKGYGFGILAGLEIARADVMAWTHADLQTDLMDITKAYEVYNSFPEEKRSTVLVKGYRRKRKLMETLLSSGMAMISSWKLGTWLTEINAQPKLFNRSFYEQIVGKAPYDFSLDLYWVLQAKRWGSIATIPVLFLPRTAGEAKGGSGSSLKTKWKIIRRTLTYIDQLKKST